jgi:transposase
MTKKIFVLILSIGIIICCTAIKSEANVIPARNGISLAKEVGGGQTGSGGKTSSGASQSRNCATGRCGHRIPKPEEDRRGKGKGKSVKRNEKKRKGKNKKRRCKKSSAKSRRKRKMRLLPVAEKELILKKKNRKGPKEEKLSGNMTEGSITENELKIRSERADDIPLLPGIMMRMGMDRVLEKHIPKHWKQRDLSQGRTCIIWLAYILSEGDHRKVSVRGYIKDMRTILSDIMGRKIKERDFTDDRCGILLKNLSKREYWEKIEKELSERTIEVYELPKDKMTVRCDATTVSGYHKIKKGGLFQKGVSKDDPHRPQIKIMTGALDPSGMPLAADVVSGERADDVLYRPIIKRMNEYLCNDAVLYVGDCKIGAFETRLYIKGIEKHYLCPLPLTGKVAIQMEELIRIGVMKDKQGRSDRVYADKDDTEVLIAKGYEYRREQTGDYEGKKIRWKERVLVVNSHNYAKSQARRLEKRLKNATAKLLALTPQRGRGKRQITDENVLKAAIGNILKRHKAEGLLRCEYVKEIERIEKYIGKGRGSVDRPWKIIERVRYQITVVKRREYRIRREKERQGWKIFVTDVSSKRLCFGDVVKSYRKEYRVEKIFNRLKSRLKASPLYVKREDQIVGMCNFLTLGVRVMALAEYTVRRTLRKDQAALKGQHPENRKKLTDTPTAERLLKAFSKITLTIIKSGDSVKKHLTPLSNLQHEILRRLGLDCSIYKNLEFEKSPSKLSEW